MISISNDRLAVTVNEKGAELQSLQLDGREYLWQADPKFWSKRSPVLFPIVGELRDGKYLFAGKEYELPRHGFARDKTFDTETIECRVSHFYASQR
jgi:galactose mutarotase-like enzyme